MSDFSWDLCVSDKAAQQCVKFHAGRLSRRAPKDGRKELRDALMQEGSFGLVKAEWRFDPSREVQFATYAEKFVLGAMHDYLRVEPEVPFDVLEPETTHTEDEPVHDLRLRAEFANGRRETVEQSVILGLAFDDLQDALGNLPQRERKFIRARLQWPTGPTLSIRETAEKLGITPMQARGLERSAYRRLREQHPELREYLDSAGEDEAPLIPNGGGCRGE